MGLVESVDVVMEFDKKFISQASVANENVINEGAAPGTKS